LSQFTCASVEEKKTLISDLILALFSLHNFNVNFSIFFRQVSCVSVGEKKTLINDLIVALFSS